MCVLFQLSTTPCSTLYGQVTQTRDDDAAAAADDGSEHEDRKLPKREQHSYAGARQIVYNLTLIIVIGIRDLH